MSGCMAPQAPLVPQPPGSMELQMLSPPTSPSGAITESEYMGADAFETKYGPKKNIFRHYVVSRISTLYTTAQAPCNVPCIVPTLIGC